MAGAGLSAMHAHRRSLVTTASAGAVLCALWFVPSARATPDNPTATATDAAPRHQAARHLDRAETAAVDRARLADTGGVDTTPYVIAGLGFLGTGGVLIVRAARRAQ